MQPGETSITFPQTPPQTPFTDLIPNQNIAIVSQFRLTSGVLLTDVPLAYRTWGKLNDEGTNCMVICHALTGSADVEDWWGPLVGPGLVFDPTRYFIFCANALGSPYGSASPVSINPKTGKKWGPEFPSTTMRDDVNLQKILLDHFAVRTVSVVIGGSMGGMTCLEWPLCTPPGYVLNIVPIATCPRHSAWGISWGEAQRQSIYSDPKYCDGYYEQDDPPAIGLAAARMAALLTYRSRDSFESRFGRKQVLPKPSSSSSSINANSNGTTAKPSTQREQLIEKATLEALTAHNDGIVSSQAVTSSPQPVVKRNNNSRNPPKIQISMQSKHLVKYSPPNHICDIKGTSSSDDSMRIATSISPVNWTVMMSITDVKEDPLCSKSRPARWSWLSIRMACSLWSSSRNLLILFQTPGWLLLKVLMDTTGSC
ncbi:homoserine O-acetyltransferase [Puccinia graminis f. sp. tritici CRL 75-36-700-3]|uniref:Homoserine O-acetyltransferase n=1 Tax=Puccinia graminis f. sp. tritici (strain CRL 75-36-700-3 / race SCCL) TaxID=418459 RepID=E3K0F0_PUCGT|nr:homoserine O-acetyltransferase [Puccinia graminis f. sp. tritici CRL 75-36-700-3]EFP77775.2 homoserine O-acetyltransferase [Puccinia graminis f. sp. tritici CRL 75-36-700-3]